MVQPVQHGYSDYGRYRAIADVLQVSASNDTIVGFKAYPVKFVGNTNGLILTATNATVACHLSVTFYADLAATIALATIDVDMGTVHRVNQPIRVLGPYAQLAVSVNGGATCTINVQMWNTDGLGYGSGLGVDPTLISQNNAAIGSGANQTFVATTVRLGELAWSMRTAATAWSAKVQALSFNGTTVDLDQVDQSLAAQLTSRKMYAPAAMIQVVVHNGDATAKNFDVWLSRQTIAG